MKIPAAQLKTILKKLGALQSEQYVFADGKVYATEPNLILIAGFVLDSVTPFSVNAQKFSALIGKMEGDVEMYLEE